MPNENKDVDLQGHLKEDDDGMEESECKNDL